jgi:hypothetical protein
MGPIGCPETSVKNCHYSLRNKPLKSAFSRTSFFEINRAASRCVAEELLYLYCYWLPGGYEWFADADVACLFVWVCNFSVPGKINILLFFVVCMSFFSPYKRNERCSIEIKSPCFFERVSNLIVLLKARSQLYLPIAICRSLTALHNRTWWETCGYWEELKGRAAAGNV